MFVIAGPCVIEDYETMMEIASIIKDISNRLNIEIYFKSSFDKANRTSIKSYRGPGIDDGLKLLKEIKDKYNLKIVTDIHEPYQADIVKDVCDIIQIPAFLCRQTDLLVAAANTDRIINIKKGQFIAPWDMSNVVKKVESTGNNNIILCERGTCFGYNNLVVDMTSIYEMKKLGYPVIFDATHSVQKPGLSGEFSGGKREYVETLTLAAVAAGSDGLFFEVHPNPEIALSDGANMITLDVFEKILTKSIDIYNIVHKKD